VLAASGNIRGRPPLTSVRPQSDEPRVLQVEDAPDDDETEDYRVWAVRGELGGSPIVAYVGSGPEAVSEPVGSLVRSLALALPLLMAVLVALVWYLVGRSLVAVAAAQTRQRAFVADASHELQGPLAALRTELEVALDHPERTHWPRVARLVLDDSDRMERLVRDLLFLAREEAAEAEVRPVDLDDVVLEEATRLCSRSAVAVDTRAVSAAPVSGSRDELARAVRNLLDNAARFAETTVTVTTRVCADGAIELTVADDGPGVPPEHQQHIFERFYRGDPARTTGEASGTGLGLAIVRAVAERHGGSVHLSHAGAGARFVLRLPQAS
jgi:signal transduction histidine kinase